MDYEAFRTAVYSLLAERKEWKVEKDWEDGTSPGSEGPGSGADGLDEFIELEQENGPFYELITVSVGQLYQVFVGEGWNAVRRELDKYTRRENPGARRTRAVDYEERLNEEGVLLYRELRALRAANAAKRGLPQWKNCAGSMESARRTPGCTERSSLRRSGHLREERRKHWINSRVRRAGKALLCPPASAVKPPDQRKRCQKTEKIVYRSTNIHCNALTKVL